MMSDDFDIKLLYAALEGNRESLGLTWTGVAREIEQRYARVSPSTIKGIRDKRNVEGDGVLQMLLWLQRSPESFVPGLADRREYRLDEPLGKVLRWDTPKIYHRLDEKRQEEDLTWREVGARIGGVSAPMLTRYRSGGRTSFPVIMRIVQWLNVPAKSLTRQSEW